MQDNEYPRIFTEALFIIEKNCTQLTLSSISDGIFINGIPCTHSKGCSRYIFTDFELLLT